MQGMTHEQLRLLILAGANLDISSKGRTTAELRLLALAAADNGHRPRLILRDLDGRSYEELRLIALAGKGCVTFQD